MRILLIDGDADLLQSLGDSLGAESYAVDVATEGKEGSYLARTNHYDLIVLGHSLPGRGGSAVMRDIRAAGLSTPIVFLTPTNDLDQRIAAFNGGADDCLSKPFAYPELSVRVRAILRRPASIRDSTISASGIVLDLTRQTATFHGANLYLTRKEYSLLEYLLRNKNSILSRSAIMEHVWSADSDPFSNTIESHMTNLRRKISRDGELILRNIPGRGYLIADEPLKKSDLKGVPSESKTTLVEGPLSPTVQSNSISRRNRRP